MAGKNPPNLLGVPKRKSGKDLGYQKTQKLVSRHDFAGQNPRVIRTKTDGRIGSATPPADLKGGFTVNNNQRVQPHHGPLGGVAAKHLSPNHEGGDVWSPRVKKARAMAKPNPKPYANPVNAQVPNRLVRKKPD
jgi:hypothetical protein